MTWSQLGCRRPEPSDVPRARRASTQARAFTLDAAACPRLETGELGQHPTDSIHKAECLVTFVKIFKKKPPSRHFPAARTA